MQSRRQGGFVLVLVLVLVVVLTLLAGAVAVVSTQAVDEAQADEEAFQATLDAVATRDVLLFMLGTQPMTIAGLSTGPYTSPVSGTADSDGLAGMPRGDEIRLDGRHYTGAGNTMFSIQDDRGLVSLNWAGTLVQNALLESYGVPAEVRADYQAILEDYQDEDDLKHLNGAESDEYARAGLPGPANHPLATPIELRKVLKWRDLIADTSDLDLLSRLTVARVPDLNINSAPASILQLLPGVDAQSALRIIDHREVTPFTSVHTARTLFNLGALQEDSVNLFPINSGNLILWDRVSGARTQLHWTLSLFPDGRPPWRIDYEIRLPRHAKPEPEPKQTQTPTTDLFGTQAQTRANGTS